MSDALAVLTKGLGVGVVLSDVRLNGLDLSGRHCFFITYEKL